MVNPISQIGKINKMRQMGDQKKKQMQTIKVTGASDKNRVELTLNGLYEMQITNIIDELLDPSKKDMLTKAIESAYSEARKKLEKEIAKTMDIKQIMEMLGNA